jgi:hypothetical protein
MPHLEPPRAAALLAQVPEPIVLVRLDLPEDNVVIKQEADEAMEDAAMPSAGDVLPEYEALLASGYDEEALLQLGIQGQRGLLVPS